MGPYGITNDIEYTNQKMTSVTESLACFSARDCGMQFAPPKSPLPAIGLDWQQSVALSFFDPGKPINFRLQRV